MRLKKEPPKKTRVKNTQFTWGHTAPVPTGQRTQESLASVGGEIISRLNTAVVLPSKAITKRIKLFPSNLTHHRRKLKNIYRNTKIAITSTQQGRIHNVWHAIKVTGHGKNIEEKNQSGDTNPKLTQM